MYTWNYDFSGVAHHFFPILESPTVTVKIGHLEHNFFLNVDIDKKKILML